jgi:hypothetical protein
VEPPPEDEDVAVTDEEEMPAAAESACITEEELSPGSVTGEDDEAESSPSHAARNARPTRSKPDRSAFFIPPIYIPRGNPSVKFLLPLYT